MKKIEKGVLKKVLHESKLNSPDKSVGILKARKKTITGVSFLSNSLSSERDMFRRLKKTSSYSKDFGTVHSHIPPNLNPSKADLKFFKEYGKVHIIVTPPFTENTWKAFNSKGIEEKIAIIEREGRRPSSEKLLQDYRHNNFLGFHSLSS